MIELLAPECALGIFLFGGLFFVVRLVRQNREPRRGALFICGFIPHFTVFAAYVLFEDYKLGVDRLWIEDFSCLASILCLNLYLLQFFSFTKNLADLKDKVQSQRIVYFYILTLFLSYIYVFQALGLHDMVAGTITHKFSDSLYFVVITLTTVGYGDLVPTSQFCRMFAGLAAINSYLVLALFLSIVLPRFLVLSDGGADMMDSRDPME